MTLHAQTRNFNGLWKGTLNKDDGTDLTLKIYIDNNNVYATHIDEDGDLAKDLNKEVIWSKAFGEQLVFVWIDAGGVWTETQMFSISFVREGKLSVYYTRHVSNESDDYDGNTDWGYTATGYFYQE
jgi:hypothetical protein